MANEIFSEVGEEETGDQGVGRTDGGDDLPDCAPDRVHSLELDPVYHTPEIAEDLHNLHMESVVFVEFQGLFLLF